MNIAIDGPGGAGKSSVAKEAAAKLGLQYMDTGAMFRAAGWALRQKGADLDSQASVEKALADVTIDVIYDDQNQQHVLVDGQDVNGMIRTPQAGADASKAAVYPCVRQKLLALQRQTAQKYDVIMDGRDIGTVVLPNADLKLFITADPEERGRRRFLQLEQEGKAHPDLATIIEEIKERDWRDSHREIAPLKQADDAVLIDTTHLTKEQVVAKVCGLIEECRAKERGAGGKASV